MAVLTLGKSFLSRISNFLKLNPLLSLILILGLALRFIGVYPGLFKEGDELLYGQAIYSITHHTLQMEQSTLVYPPLTIWIMILLFLLFFIPATILLFFIKVIFSAIFYNAALPDFTLRSFNSIFNSQIIGINGINAMYWGRYITAFFGTSAILLSFYLGKIYFKDLKIALIISFLAAVNYRLVLNSRLGLPDIYNIFFLLISLITAKLLIGKPTFKNYLFTALAATALFLVKYQFYGFLIFGLAHLVSSFNCQGSLNVRIKKLFTRNFFSSLIFALLFIVISHVSYFSSWKEVIALNQYQSLKYGFGLNKLYYYPISYLYYYGVGVVTSLLGILGLLYGLQKKEFRESSLLLLPPVIVCIFLYFYFSNGGFFTRNLLPLILITLIFAALALNLFIDLIVKKLKINSSLLVVFFSAIILIVVSFNQLRDSLISSYYYAQTSPRVEVKNWIEQNVKGQIIFAIHHSDPEPLAAEVKLFYLPDISQQFSYQELAVDNINLALVDTTSVQGAFLWWMLLPLNTDNHFWKKPDELLSEGFYALAYRELLRSHLVRQFTTPWQAPGFNYLIVSGDLKNQQLRFNNKNLAENISWNKLTLKSTDQKFLILNEENQPTIKEGQKGTVIPGGLRWQTAAFEIKPGFAYKLSAEILNSTQLDKNKRDGFIRLDFYRDNPQQLLTENREISFVSERVYGDSGWHKVNIEEIAPKDAKFATISFQADNREMDFTLKNLSLLENMTVVDWSEKQQTISDTNLFLPNNNGFH